jgi:DNA primase catalytic core
MTFERADLDQIKQSVDIVTYAQNLGLELKQVGHRFRCSCPFHDDKTPSFYINPNEGYFHCFGCNKHGDVITLAREMNQLSFPEAVDHLKARVGYYPKENPIATKPPEQKQTKLHSKLRGHLDDVVQHYHEDLLKHRKANQYLQRRGITKKAIDRFQIGYAGFRPLQLPPKQLEPLQQIGLFNKFGREAYIGRIVVPIRNKHDEIAQIYGRSISDGKFNHYYLRLPHTTLFNPQSFRNSKIYLCESVIDTLSMYSNGVENACGIYGTHSLKDKHLEELVRSDADEIIIAYDNDKAGNDAAADLSEKLKKHNFKTSRLKLPKGKDVNQYLTDQRR